MDVRENPPAAKRPQWLAARITGTVAVVIAVLLITMVASRREPRPVLTLTTEMAGVAVTAQQSSHTTQPVSYVQTPPAGGAHAPAWLNCGAYEAPVQNENAVHSLEHGAVWITYRPGIASQDVASLKRIAAGLTYVIVSPFDGLKNPVTLSAWGRQLGAISATDPQIAKFVARYRLADSAPEPGAPCTGGVGTPAE